MDRVLRNHWKYNSPEDVEYYKEHRLTVDKVYKQAPKSLPFRDMIDDMVIRGIESKRYSGLGEKSRDLGDMLGQGYIGTYSSSNPYYDNSVDKVHIDGFDDDERRRIMKEEFEEFDRETEEYRKKRKVDMVFAPVSSKYPWFLEPKVNREKARIDVDTMDTLSAYAIAYPFSEVSKNNRVMDRMTDIHNKLHTNNVHRDNRLAIENMRYTTRHMNVASKEIGKALENVKRETKDIGMHHHHTRMMQDVGALDRMIRDRRL